MWVWVLTCPPHAPGRLSPQPTRLLTGDLHLKEPALTVMSLQTALLSEQKGGLKGPLPSVTPIPGHCSTGRDGNPL